MKRAMKHSNRNRSRAREEQFLVVGCSSCRAAPDLPCMRKDDTGRVLE
jgi:hypothetical protein